MDNQSYYYDYQLTIDKILDSGCTTFPNQEIVYRDLRRYTFSSFSESVKRLKTGLRRLGVRRGDRIGVIDWDTDVFLHLYYAIPSLGSTLHTVNIRYPPDLIIKTILQAEDKYLIVRDEFMPLVEKAKNLIPPGMKIITYNDNKEKVKSDVQSINFWDLIESNEPSEPEELNERTEATLFFTSGTTGEPKGVSFTHRDLVLHALSVSLVGSRPPINISSSDVYLILVPMFHVHAWGYPYVFMISGIKYVLPGKYDYGNILRLMDKEKVTFSAMVPTILYLLITHPDSQSFSHVFKRWRVVIGGSALPEGLARKAKELGITVVGGYGLSETAPVLTVGFYNSLIMNSTEDQKFMEQITAGTTIPLVELKVIDPATNSVVKGKKIGEIVVRSPWLTKEYYKDKGKTELLWRGGWLHTGDMGFIDDYGYLHVVDREKDAIKSGGEFIPTLLLEDVISLHPNVSQVAVVGINDEKWGERPIAFIVPNGKVSEDEIRQFLQVKVNEGRIQKWWIPDKFIFVSSLPLTSTNKIDKKMLRDMAKK
ncbi:long-chain fatty acid--CoA ligase [Candidatus Acidianus copahuensis]|uniref:Long-chain fatty acid--CoA ligase n=1 Tax=Candidatus Acidianus copahuensis TaxID=1160895 RepID=A0A031LUQ8_9CREN|nr:long-chain-fatty-acid--CoA ligase [Candidatus Acidianus copahuensis]EZQ11224.1 long-chain fatty acid--CoA ligase [Candidatus Acidianus copahuensis]